MHQRQLLGTFLILFILFWGWVYPVLAHSLLQSAEPSPGAYLVEPPTHIQLIFTEPLAEGSTLTLYSGFFQEVSGIESAIDPQKRQNLVSAVPTLSPGQYTVQWTSIGLDGDTVTGSYSFAIQPPANDAFNLNLIGPIIAGALAIASGAHFLWRRIQRKQTK